MAKNRSGDTCYVYVLLDPRKPGKFSYGNYSFKYEPFYVGKGSRNRYAHHINARSWIYNKFKGRVIQKILSEGLQPLVRRRNCSSEIEAFALEIKLISLIGRRDLGLGPLTNLTDGGDGVAGRLASRQLRKKLSRSHKARWKNLTPEDRQRIGETLSITLRSSQKDVKLQIRKNYPDIELLEDLSYPWPEKIECRISCGCVTKLRLRQLKEGTLSYVCFSCKFEQALSASKLNTCDEPQKSRDMVRYQCDDGHTFTTRATHVLYGDGSCFECNVKRRTLKVLHLTKDDCKFILQNPETPLIHLSRKLGVGLKAIRQVRNGIYPGITLYGLQPDKQKRAAARG